MEKLKDIIMMSDAYCEMTDCRGIESCEECVKLNIAKHNVEMLLQNDNTTIYNLGVYITASEFIHLLKTTKLKPEEIKERILNEYKISNK